MGNDSTSQSAEQARLLMLEAIRYGARPARVNRFGYTLPPEKLKEAEALINKWSEIVLSTNLVSV